MTTQSPKHPVRQGYRQPTAATEGTSPGISNDELTEGDYQTLAELLEGRVGIRLPAAKRTMLESRLRKRVRSLGLPGLDAYCHELFARNQLESELVHLIDAVTTNKTDFFREPEHFDFMRREAVPRLLAQRGEWDNRPLKVWSAACSNGAEPYTLAMVLSEIAAGTKFRFAVLGTDICMEVLEQAVSAIYPEEMMAPVPADLQYRYVMRSCNPSRREARIVPELRRSVHFMRLNLMDARYPVDQDVDIIFCRNVLIYFERANQQAVVERLSRHLRPGGYLFLGHSECLAANTEGLERQSTTTVFRRDVKGQRHG